MGSRVNSAAITGNAATQSVTITIPSGTGVASGDLIVVTGNTRNVATPAVTCKDSVNNVNFTQLAQVVASTSANRYQTTFYYQTPQAIADLSTITIAGPAGVNFTGGAVDIFRGYQAVIDQAVTTANSPVTAGTSAAAPALGANATAGSLVLTFLAVGSPATAITAGAPFSAGSTDNTCLSGVGFVLSASGVSTYASTWTWTTAETWAAQTVSFKASSAGPAGFWTPPGLQSPMTLAQPLRPATSAPPAPPPPGVASPPPLLTPPGLQSPMVLAEPLYPSQPAPLQLQPAPAPQLVPPGLQSPMSLTVPSRPATFTPPPPQPPTGTPAPQPVPPGLQSPMALGVPTRPATAAPPPPPVVTAGAPPPLLVPPGLQSPMSLTVPSRPATSAPPPPPVVTAQPPPPLLTPPGLQSPMVLAQPGRPATAAPCVKLTNNAEEGTSGVTVTPGNSGGAPSTAFDVVSTGASATLTYDNAQAADGALSFKVTTPGAATNSYASWTTKLGSPQTQAWFRVYLYFATVPANTFRVWTGVNGATNCASLQVTSAGKLQWIDATNATILNSTFSIPIGAWFWVEGFLVGSPTAGQVELKLYLSTAHATPDETDTSTATQNTFGQVTGARFGVSGSTANISFWMDDIGVSTCGYLGPAFTPVFPPIPSGVIFGGQSAGGDRDPEIRMFRSVMPGEVPVSGSQLPKLHGRGYAAPPPTRADDIEVLWEAPPEPAEPPGPTPAEIARREAQKAAKGLYDLGRIIAPEPYVPPAKVRCGAIRKLGTEVLRCNKKRGHAGMHSDRGVRWG